MYKLIICGNVVRRPESRDVNGVRNITMTVAVNYWARGAQQTDYVRVTAWRSVAEKCEKYLDKGHKVICWGRPSVHAWNAKEDNAARGQMELDAEDVEFVGRPVENSEEKPVEKPVENRMVESDDEALPF